MNDVVVVDHVAVLAVRAAPHPVVKTNKNDRNYAKAIAEAAGRPTMRFVTVKSVLQPRACRRSP